MIPDYILIPTGRKNNILMLGGYTFAQVHNNRWYCSKKKIGCKARIKMDTDSVTILEANNVHNHDPPQYYVTKEGEYVFLGTREKKIEMNLR